MAYYNQNFYNRNYTFQNNTPPPPPQRFCVPPPQITDQDFVKQFERNEKKVDKKTPSITQVKEKMRGLVLTLNDLKEKEKMLQNSIDTLDELQWDAIIKSMHENQMKIDETLLLLNDSCLESMRQALAQRSAKRLRQKRAKIERKREWEELVKARRENSRRIDERLQKIKDDIDIAKRDEEAKLQADSILRDVLRKKHDAKKCVTKLEALVRLRVARQNTARGRGEQVPEGDGEEFNNNVAKLISLWNVKLSNYSEEERQLRSKLKESQPTAVSRTEEILLTLGEWRRFLFGGEPQFDFNGDVASFLAVRAQWDQYIDNGGSSLPTGWVAP